MIAEKAAQKTKVKESMASLEARVVDLEQRLASEEQRSETVENFITKVKNEINELNKQYGWVRFSATSMEHAKENGKKKWH
jgi:uncharacterized coiled-coil protein SlyX